MLLGRNYPLMDEESVPGDASAGGAVSESSSAETATGLDNSDSGSQNADVEPKIPDFFGTETDDTQPSGNDQTDGDPGPLEADDTASKEAVKQSDSFSPEIQNRAAMLGFTFGEMQELGSQKALEAAVAIAERNALSLQAHYEAQLGQRQAAAQQANPQQQASNPTQQALNESADGIAKLEAEIEEMVADGFDEKFINHNRNVLRHMQSQHQVLSQQIQQINQFMGHAQQAARIQQQQLLQRDVDSVFNSLSPQLQTVLGKGDTNQMDQTSPQFAARQQVMQFAASIGQSLQQAGQQVALSDILKRAVAAAFPDQMQSIARSELSGKLKTASKQAISRQSPSDADKNLSPEEKAFRRFDEKMRELNLS